MYRVVYVSSASRPFSSVELEQFAASWKTRNAEAGITGVCLYIGGNFMQAFEGDEKRAQSLYGWIRADSRHKNVITILEEKADNAPVFGDWSLDFREAADLPSGEREQFRSFIETALGTPALHAAPAALRLLSHFVRTMHPQAATLGTV